jgi:hypothetical protein
MSANEGLFSPFAHLLIFLTSPLFCRSQWFSYFFVAQYRWQLMYAVNGIGSFLQVLWIRHRKLLCFCFTVFLSVYNVYTATPTSSASSSCPPTGIVRPGRDRESSLANFPPNRSCLRTTQCLRNTAWFHHE